MDNAVKERLDRAVEQRRRDFYEGCPKPCRDDIKTLQAVVVKLSWGYQARRNAAGVLCWCRDNVLEVMPEEQAVAYMTAIGRLEHL